VVSDLPDQEVSMNSNQRDAIRADVLRVMRRGEQRWWVPTQLSRAIADLPVEGDGQRLQPRATAVSEVLLGLLAEGLVARHPDDSGVSPERYALPWAAQEEARERQSGAAAAESTDDARERAIKAMAASTVTPFDVTPAPAERPEPLQPSFTVGRNADGTWFVQADGLSQGDALTVSAAVQRVLAAGR
jgi:hypothetical protein